MVLERTSTICWIAATYFLLKGWLRQVEMVGGDLTLLSG